MPKSPNKQTIYIDVEDEITAIIDKLRKSDAKVVALVLPKRAATLQSTVNLKLLKRTAQDLKKNIVLITSDTTILPLAGSVGLHVAKTLQSKPAIPKAPESVPAEVTVDSDEELAEPEIDKTTPIGQLAAEETIELDNSEVGGTDTAKPSKTRKFKIPNFDKFRTRLILGVAALVLLVVFWVFASVVLPKATIEIKTNTSVVNTTISLVARTDTEEVDAENKVVPALTKEVTKSATEKVPATGERNDGKKAQGSVEITNCSSSTKSFPAGTEFLSNGRSFLSDKEVTVPQSGYSFTPGGFVCDEDGTASVNLTARAGGEAFNIAAGECSISGSPANVSANCSDMKGGTDKITKIVQQSDIDGARQAALDRLGQEANGELEEQFRTDQAIAINDTLEAGKATVAATPKVNEAGNDVTVTVNLTYKQIGVKKEHLTPIVEADIKEKIDEATQAIQNTGLDEARLRLATKVSGTEFKLDLQTIAVAGAQQDAEAIKKAVAGQKKGPAKDIILARPGVEDVEIKYSPFWVLSTPSRTSRINIVFIQSNGDIQ